MISAPTLTGRRDAHRPGEDGDWDGQEAPSAKEPWGPPEAGTANNSALDCSLPELRENKFLLLKPFSLWDFVMTVLAD